MSLRSEVGLAVLLAGAVGIAVAAGSVAKTPASELENASTFLAGPGGAKGVYDVMARMGRPVARRRVNLFDLVTDSAVRPAILIEADPAVGLESGEMTQVAEFLRRGGTVVAAGYAGGIVRCAGWSAIGTFSLGLHRDTMPIAPVPGFALPGVRSYLRQRPPRNAVEDSTTGANPIAELNGVRCPLISATSIDTLVRTYSGHPVLVSERIAGGGHLLLLADDGWLRNRAWRTTGVPDYVLPLLTPEGASGQVQWDEFHQGHAQGGSLLGATWHWLVGTPAGWVIDQLALVLLVWLAVTAVRFGPARSVIDRRRRSPLEHLEALAAGFEGAGGNRTVLNLIVGGLQRRLSRTGHGPGSARPGEEWIAALALAMPTAQGRGAVRRLREAFTKPGGDERVLAAANSVEDVWEELRPRTMHDGFSKP
ncbi:MAG TPA: DUF4350 domain-containing protein [Gemmatimonadales bacterium]|jgi:hypothetical protein|nr:DUF4350 domain-containing protein [Gemmatimonadales bacterium]